MEENNVQEAEANEANEASEAVEAPKEKKEMAEKPRKITGIIIMAVGAIVAVTMSALAGVLILLGGMWAYNPEVKDGDNKKTVSTWAGTLLIIVAVVVIAWAVKAFVL